MGEGMLNLRIYRIEWFCLQLGRQIKQLFGFEKKEIKVLSFLLLLFLKNIGKFLCFLMKHEPIQNSAYALKEIILMERLFFKNFSFI